MTDRVCLETSSPPDSHTCYEMNWKGKMKKTIGLIWGALLFLGSTAQSLQGVVKSADGEKLSFVNVILKEQNRSTITNSDGFFKFQKLNTGTFHLQISFVGKATIEKEVIIKENETLDLGKLIMQDAQFKTEEVIVTATRTARLLNSIPASVEYLSSKEIQALPSQKIDENLKYSSGIFVDRPFGIFGKSVVTMRGVVSSEPGRQLTLIDGVPINKSDGGGVNWNRIISSDIQHIEAIKGPSSSIYGSNAMGGTINLITKIPQQKGLSGTAKMYYGTFNTMGTEFSLMQKFSDNAKGFYYAISGKILRSDGYNTVPDSIREEIDTLVFVQEQATNARIGYRFSNHDFLELEYNYYNDHRGQGTKIRLEDGATADYDTHFLKSKYKAQFGQFNLDINGFYQLEQYLRSIEKIKRGDYTLIDVHSDRADYGLLSSISRTFGKHKTSFGIDVRNGSVNGVDEYQTSTDKIINKGDINHINIYLQDEFNISKKIKGIASLHFSYINFHDGAFLMEESTGINDFMKRDTGKLEEKSWSGWTPSISFQYDINKTINIYTVASSGFRTASLDDLTRTGFINIGYKKANPLLSPETINNIELGSRYSNKKLLAIADVYYSQGFDFMYYVATGESLFGGRKKVYQKENISEVEIFGTELSAQYNLKSWLSFRANYTYNQSKIKKFNKRTDLKNKTLTYSPENIFNFTTIISNKKWSSSLNIHWQDRIFLDEENSFVIDALIGFDTRISYKFYKGFGAGLNIQNMFNEQHMVSTDQVSLGRFITFELNYKF